MKTKLYFNFLVSLLIISVTLLIMPPSVIAQYNSDNVTLMGRSPFGYCKTTYADGNYLYIGNGTCLDVLYVSDPNNPVLVGQLITESVVRSIQVSGDYAYIANWSDGFMVIDISDPTTPREVADIPFDWRCWSVSVFGNFAYVGNDTLGMRIVDISTPTSPILRGTFNPPGTSTIEKTQIIDTLAYVASNSGLFIVDISDPDLPVQIGYSPSPSNGSYNVHVVNNVAYLPEFNDGIRMVDVTDPYSPQGIGYFDTPGSAEYFEINGNYGYVADRNSGLYVVDMINPISPDSVFVLDTKLATTFNIQGNYLYLADGGGGCKIVDISNPALPDIIGSYNVGGSHSYIYTSNGYLYNTQYERGLSIFDVTSPTSPIEIATLDMEWATGLHGYGDYIYVADDGDLRIIDVSNPYSPLQVGFWDYGWVSCVYVDGNNLYLGGSPDLAIVDISNPSLPLLLGEVEGLPGHPRRVFVTGDYAYLANQSGGLRIINVSNPSFPYEEGVFDTVDNIVAVQVSGEYAYLTDRYVSLLRVVDVSNVSAPYQVSSLDIEYVREVHLTEKYAYVVGSWIGVRVLDISNPETPFEVGYFETKGYARAVYFNDYIYVADGGGGLYILENDFAPVEVENENPHPISFSLNQNYPNPFNPTTKISYQIPELSFVSLKVYDVLGSEVAELVNEENPAGSYQIEFDATSLSSSIYFYRLQAGTYVKTKKMVLMK